jgi:hypothetical protein
MLVYRHNDPESRPISSAHLPTGLLDTGDTSTKSVHSETELHESVIQPLMLRS